MVKRNSEEAHRRTAQYYMQRALNLEDNTWVYVHAPQAGPPYGDTLANRKLSLDWAGPYLFLRMKENSQMADRHRWPCSQGVRSTRYQGQTSAPDSTTTWEPYAASCAARPAT